MYQGKIYSKSAPTKSSPISKSSPIYGKLIYKSEAQRQEQKEQNKARPYNRTAGFFEVEMTTNGSGDKTVKILKHEVLGQGIIYEEDNEGNVLIDRYHRFEY